MSTQVFMLPDLGEGLVEAELVSWLVKVGDTIGVDQVIAEVETAKSVVEVPSPYAGIVKTLHGAAGDVLEVGKPLLSVTADAESGAEPDADSETGADSGTEVDSGSGNVLIGYGTSGESGSGRRRPARFAARPQRPESAPLAEPAPFEEPVEQLEPAQQNAVLVISPLVRKMARDAAVPLTSIQGSGAAGLITRADVETAIAKQAGAAEASEGVATVSSEATDARTGLPLKSDIKLTGMRKAAATAFTRSRREIPEATVWVDVDATALVELRQSLKARALKERAVKERASNDSDTQTPSLLAFIARFVTAGLNRFPALNSAISGQEGAESILSFDGVNLGFAAQTPRGLVVPVLRGADKLNALELDGAIRELTATARSGKASPALLSGGTFTLNNYGVFGVDGSAAIINYPEAAMLGVGRIIDKPWVVDGQLCVRKMTELTLAFDHRVCDGDVASGFLRFVADAMENPGTALMEF